jgi:hypothetical protein
MAAPLICDICQAEPGAQMLSNLADGSQMVLGAACIPDFYHQSILALFGGTQHGGPRTKCTACKAIHEHGTGAVVPIGDADDTAPDVTDDQAPDVTADTVP